MTKSIDAGGIDAVLTRGVESGAVPHVAAIVADADGVLYEGGAGVRINGESNDPVGASTQFRIMSMTKMVATAAALQQRERGQLDFDAPVSEYCPEFADVKVLEGWDGDTPILVDPRTPATVRHLVTHTSGLGYWFWNDDLVKYESATGIPNVVPGSAEAWAALRSAWLDALRAKTFAGWPSRDGAPAVTVRPLASREHDGGVVFTAYELETWPTID